MRYSATVELDGFRNRVRNTKAVLAVSCQNAANEGAVAARDHAKATTKFRDRTGRLRSSVSFERAKRKGRRWYEAVVVAAAKHARFLEWGTEGHWIGPRKKSGRLIFWWEKIGAWFVGDAGQSVWHPGIQATYFMSLGARKGYYVMHSSLERAVSRVKRIWET